MHSGSDPFSELRRFATPAALAMFFANFALPHAGAQLPLQAGDLVTTYCPDLVPLMGGGFGPDPDGACVLVVRNPLGGTLGANWLAPLFSNEIPVTSNTWNTTNIGPVFGCCLDDATSPNIYVTASTVYGNFPTSWGPGGSGGVYKINGASGAITVLATLPNAGGVGLGDVSYDRFHDQLFVTNFEDGTICRIKNGAVVQTFDPWAPDGGVPGFAPLGERLWAVHVPDAKHLAGRVLFFSAWLCDQGRTNPGWPALWPTPAPATPNNTVFMVRLLADGSIDTVNPPKVSVVMPTFQAGYSNPVSDIVYNNRRLILAERSMNADFGTTGLAHRARVLRYQLTSPAVPIGAPLFVGDFNAAGTNCAGGIALDTDLTVANPPHGNVWTTGDALQFFGPSSYIYGVQLLPDAGNGTCVPHSACTNLIDLDYITTQSNKSQPGDVEYFPGSHSVFDPNTPYPFCHGDAYVACPCENYGDIGRGCANSVDPSGGLLDLSGMPLSNDVALHASGMPMTATCLFLQGDQETEIVFGDGVRCVGGALVRLRARMNVAGTSSFPDVGDTVTLSARGGVTPGSGAVRAYQVYYRNSAALYCPPTTFNITNAWNVTW